MAEGDTSAAAMTAMMENPAFQSLMAKMAAAAIAEAAKANTPSSASPSASAEPTKRPALRPFVPLRVDKPFDGRSGPDAAAAYIALCENNFEENARFFKGDDADSDKVRDAARGLSDVALVWYNNLRNQKSPKLLSWSLFREAFEAMFANALGLANPFETLFRQPAKMLVTELCADFNARTARLPADVDQRLLVAAFRSILPPALAQKVEDSRCAQKGGRKDWDTVADMMSVAISLAPSIPTVKVAAMVSGSGSDQAGRPKKGRSLTPKEAADQGGCAWCRRVVWENPADAHVHTKASLCPKFSRGGRTWDLYYSAGKADGRADSAGNGNARK